MIINGIELTFDATDAETLDKYLTAIDKCAERANGIENPGEDREKLVKTYRDMCGYMKDAFDDIFGEGTGNKVCGEGNSVHVCRDAYSCLMREYNQQMADEKRLNDEFKKLMKSK